MSNAFDAYSRRRKLKKIENQQNYNTKTEAVPCTENVACLEVGKCVGNRRETPNRKSFVQFQPRTSTLFFF